MWIDDRPYSSTVNQTAIAVPKSAPQGDKCYCTGDRHRSPTPQSENRRQHRGDRPSNTHSVKTSYDRGDRLSLN